MKDGKMKIGTVCDDYKEKFFVDYFKKHGFDSVVQPGVTKNTRLIAVYTSKENFKRDAESIRRLCVKLEHIKPWRDN